MLRRLPASRPDRRRPGAHVLWATAVHAGLIGAAIATTRPAPDVPGPPRLDTIPIHDFPRGPDGPSLPALPGPAGPPSLRGPIDVGIPDLLPPGPGLSISSSRTRRVAESGAPGGGLFGASAAGTDGPLLARLADEPPYRLAGPGLHYPERLRAAGIAGEVVVEVVVGVDGRPEPASARVIASTDRRFDAHALAVVVRSRYRPGRVAGRPVRVLVRHAVRFSLD